MIQMTDQMLPLVRENQKKSLYSAKATEAVALRCS